MKFEPSELQELLEYRFGKQPDVVGQVIAEFCNSKLEAWLSEAPLVYVREYGDGFAAGPQRYREDIYTAKLVCFEDLPKAKAPVVSDDA